MFSKQVPVMAVELTEDEIKVLSNARKIVDDLISLMVEIDTTYSRLLCEVNFEDESFTISEMEDIAFAISTICDAYRIEI